MPEFVLNQGWEDTKKMAQSVVEGMQLEDVTRFYIFLHQYMTALVWSEHDDDIPEWDMLSFLDVAEGDVNKVVTECLRIFGAILGVLQQEAEQTQLREVEVIKQGAVDFVLTRNGHGAGFWDGDWCTGTGLVLTHYAQSFPEQSLYAYPVEGGSGQYRLALA